MGHSLLFQVRGATN